MCKGLFYLGLNNSSLFIAPSQKSLIKSTVTLRGQGGVPFFKTNIGFKISASRHRTMAVVWKKTKLLVMHGDWGRLVMVDKKQKMVRRCFIIRAPILGTLFCFSRSHILIKYVVHVKRLLSSRAQSQGQTQFLSLSPITLPELPEKLVCIPFCGCGQGARATCTSLCLCSLTPSLPLLNCACTAIPA